MIEDTQDTDLGAGERSGWRWQVLEFDEPDPALDAPSPAPRFVGSGEGQTEARAWMDQWQGLSRDLAKVAQIAAYERKPQILPERRARAYVELGTCDSLLTQAVKGGASAEEAGRQMYAFATGLFARLREAASETLPSDDHARQAVTGWAALVCDGLGSERHAIETWKAANGKDRELFEALAGPETYDTDRAVKTLKRRMWGTQGRNPDKGYARQAAVGLRWTVATAIATLATGWVERPPGKTELAAELLAMLPERLAFKLDRRIQKAPSDLAEVSAADFEPYLTPLQEVALPRIRSAVGNERSMLVVSPPGCGKTSIGQIAASHALHAGDERSKVLMVLPTKALVDETYEDWLAWIEGSGTGWRVVPGSQDHRQFAPQLARGEFDVAICIYETVAQLLSDPQQRETLLGNCALLIVDELHQLGEPERGPRLESLLVNVKRFRRQIPVLALAPVLSRETQQRLTGWLGIAGRDCIVNFQRPVPLWMHVVDGNRHRFRQEPTIERDEPTPVPAYEECDFDVAEIMRAWDPAARRSVEDTGHMEAIALICRLLRESCSDHDGMPATKDRRIICFVNDRDRVEGVAAALRRALNQEKRHDRIRASWDPASERNPWLSGRWQRSMSESAAEGKLRELTDAESHGPSLGEVLEGLRHGVAFHSRALTRPLRRVLEREFRDGMVRVLVATDTLAEGVNLPATDVVLADVVAREADRWRLEDLQKVKQRAGRAGRLGKQEEGHAYLVVNRGLRVGQLVEHAKEHFGAVSTLEGTWEHFVVGSPEGRTIVSALDSNRDAVCDVVLRTLALELERGTREQVLELIGEISQDTFMSAKVDPDLRDEFLRRLEMHRAVILEEFDVALPADSTDTVSVMDHMEDLELVVEDERQAGQLKVSDLGRTLTRFALPIESTSSLEAIATAKRQGRSALSLIYLAACDSSITRSMGKWVSWPKWPSKGGLAAVVAAHREISEQLRRWAAAYAHPDGDVRAQAMKRLAIPVPDPGTKQDRLVIPDPSLAVPLAEPDLADPFTRAMLVEDERLDQVKRELLRLQERPLVSLLRTVVAYEWAMAEPLAAIGERLDKRVRVSPRGKGRSRPAPRRVVTWSVPDIYQLGENLAYVLNAAAALVDDLDTGDELRNLALRVESGLPEPLAPALALRVDGLHREALLSLAREADRFQSLGEALRAPELRVRTAVRTAALEALQKMHEDDEAFSLRLPKGVAGELMPGGAVTYGAAFGDILEESEPEAIARRLVSLLALHGVQTRVEHAGPAASAQVWVEDAPGFPLFVVQGQLTVGQLRTLRHGGGAVIALGTVDEPLLLRSVPGVIRLGTLFRRLQAAWAGVSPDEGPRNAVLTYLRSQACEPSAGDSVSAGGSVRAPTTGG